MQVVVLVLFFLYLVWMLRNIIKGEHTAPFAYWFLERPEVDRNYKIWWVVYGLGFIVYCGLFVFMLVLFL